MILNRQRTIRISLNSLRAFLLRVCKLVSLPHDAVTVCLVTDREIAKWNEAYRGKQGPTDVLSFPSGNGQDQEPDERQSGAGLRGRAGRHPRARRVSANGLAASRTEDTAYLGDIAIAPLVAQRNAARFGRTLNQELRILILHGVLHLMGFDHETDNGQMDRRENLLRRKLGLA